MTADKNDPRMEINKIAQLLVEDLFNTPDDELLQEATKDGSLKEAGISAKDAYQKAIHAVGTKRLQVARAEMKVVNNLTPLEVRNVDVITARKIIAKLTAANDSNLTLAARNLNNISDEEAIELVMELVELGALKGDDQF